MNIGTANYVITRQLHNSNIPFKYQVNLPWNTPVGLPKAFQRKTNWKYWIKYIKPIWCPQQILFSMKLVNYEVTLFQPILAWCNWDTVIAYHSALSIFRGNSLSIMEMDTPCLASQASHGVSMSISALVISKLATVWHLFLSSFALCTIVLDHVISSMDRLDQIS